MNDHLLEKVLRLASEFALNQNTILALGLCGSWARGTATAQSDFDLCILTSDKELFKPAEWLNRIDFKNLGGEVVNYKDVYYGLVWSRHVFLSNGIEIEFSFADRSWAHTKPVDEGTRKVVLDAYRIIYDPNHILKSLLETISNH